MDKRYCNTSLEIVLKVFRSALYLHESSLLPPNNVDHVRRYANHGRESQEQTDEMTPPRIVVIQVSQRCELGQVENENTLWKCVQNGSSVSFNTERIEFETYDADEWSGDNPAKFKPASGIVANHILDAIKEAVHSKTPWYGDALEENEPKEDEIAASVAVEQLEHVHSALMDQIKSLDVLQPGKKPLKIANLSNAGESDDKRDETDHGDKDLFTSTE